MGTHGRRNVSIRVVEVGASLLIFVSGLVHHTLVQRTQAAFGKEPLNPTALDSLTLRIGDWVGEDVPLDERILDTIGADAHVSRRYTRPNALGTVSLFIAASAMKTSSLVGHRPERCHVGAGYLMKEQHSVELFSDNGSQLPCMILQFCLGNSLSEQRMCVLIYYMADTEFCGNRSVLRSRIRHGGGRFDCCTQVQIVASTKTATAGSMVQLVSEFARQSARPIAELFERVKSGQNPRRGK